MIIHQIHMSPNDRAIILTQSAFFAAFLSLRTNNTELQFKSAALLPAHLFAANSAPSI